MNLQVIHSFVARGEATRNGISFPVTISGNYPVFAPNPVHCTIMPDMDALPAGVIVPFSEQNVVNISGLTEQGKQIWIPDFHVDRITNTRPRDQMFGGQMHWEGVADLFLEGDLDEFDASDGRIIYTIYTSPSSIAESGVMYELRGDGTIQIWEGDERKSIRWRTPLGEAEFIDGYVYHQNENVGLDQAIVRIKRCVIVIEIQNTDVASFKSMLTDLKEIFEKALWLFSFLSRKRVVWYEAKIVFYPDNNLVKDSRQAIARRNQWLGFGNDEMVTHNYPLINRQVMINDGLFAQLLTNYESSEHYSTLRQVMTHLLVSHERAYIENQYASAYTALECLVYGLDNDNNVGYLLGSNPFKKLSKKVRELIREEIPEDNVVEGINKKIPELRRRTFLEQLLIQAGKHGVDLTKLWPPGTDVEKELHALVKRRNVYIHQGKTEDSKIVLFDLNRIQNLVELWILKILGCPDKAINGAAIGHLAPIQSQL